MSDDLVEWLRAQLDEDERDGSTSHVFGCTVYDPVYEDPPRAAPMTDASACSCKARRVLREVEAGRKLIAVYAEAKGYYDAHPSAPAGELEGLYTAIKLRAEVYSDRPGYREEWRPA